MPTAIDDPVVKADTPKQPGDSGYASISLMDFLLGIMRKTKASKAGDRKQRTKRKSTNRVSR